MQVRSQPGKGSVFSIEVESSPGNQKPQSERRWRDRRPASGPGHTGAILVVEDDPSVRDLLELLLKDEGHFTAGALDGAAALDLVSSGAIRPDLIVADYNLPGGMNGLQVTAKLRERLRRTIPVVILTGDISTATLRNIEQAGCIQLNKPVKPGELIQIIQRLLSMPRSIAPAPSPAQPAGPPAPSVIFVVDDDTQVRGVMQLLFEEAGKTVEAYATCEAFLEAWRPGRKGCLLLDAYLPGMTGLELLRHLRAKEIGLPTIMITGRSDVSMAVEAMKAGALDFIEKPVGGEELLARVRRALEQSLDTSKLAAWRMDAVNQLSSLTPRQHEIMNMVLAGIANKNIAADLGISQRTVESHRAAIMKKTGAKSLPALARLALVADRAVERDLD